MKYKVFSGSERINDFLRGLRASEDELTALPMTFKIIAVPIYDKKGNKTKYRYEFYTGL